MSIVYNPADFFKTQREKILACYTNTNELVKSEIEQEIVKSEQNKDEEEDKEVDEFEKIDEEGKEVKKSEDSLESDFDILFKSFNLDIEKSKEAQINEKREWGGRTYQKQANGSWKEVKEEKERPKRAPKTIEECKKLLEYHSKQADIWAKELSDPTDLSKRMTMTEIDEEWAFHAKLERYYSERIEEESK